MHFDIFKLLHNNPSGRHRLFWNTPVLIVTYTAHSGTTYCTSPLSSADNKIQMLDNIIVLLYAKKATIHLVQIRGTFLHQQTDKKNKNMSTKPKYKYKCQIIANAKWTQSGLNCSIHFILQLPDETQSRNVLKRSASGNHHNNVITAAYVKRDQENLIKKQFNNTERISSGWFWIQQTFQL